MQNWDEYRQHYADTAKFRNNVTEEKEISLDSVILNWKQENEMFSDIHYVADKDFFEMVLTDEDETWVNFRGLFTSIPKGLNSAGALIFFVFIIGAVLALIALIEPCCKTINPKMQYSKQSTKYFLSFSFSHNLGLLLTLSSFNGFSASSGGL